MAEHDFTEVFHLLRAILAEHRATMVEVADGPTSYRLNTRHVRKDGYVLMFGAVEIKTRYVSYYLMPVYMAPAHVLPISDNLRRHMQGKSCFTFTRVDEELFAELADLTHRAVAVTDGSPFADEPS